MNLSIIKLLSSLIRHYWAKDYREIIESLKIEMRKTDDLDIFFKRLNSIGDEHSILRILNNMLIDDAFQRDCNSGWQIAFRPARDIRADLYVMLKDDGFKIENGRVTLPPFSTGLQFEKYVGNVLEKLNYEVIVQPKLSDIRPDFLITDKNDPTKKLVVEVKHYENSLVPERIVTQILEYTNKLNVDKGIIITTIGFSDDAKELAKKESKVELLTLKDLINRIPASEKESYFDDLIGANLLGTSEIELTQKQEESGLKKKKKKIFEKYELATTSQDSDVKGKLLEEVMTEILQLVPDLEVFDTRVNNRREEIDIQVRNFNRKKIWGDFDSVIFVECKNWSNPVGSDEIRNFVGKLDANGLSIGILVATNDITGNLLDGARGAIKNLLPQGKKIVVLNGEDIKEILRCTDVSDKVDEKFTELFK